MSVVGCERSERLGPGRLVGRSCERSERLAKADVAQLAERVLGKDEVTSSILVIGSNLRSLARAEVARRSAKREGGLQWVTSCGWLERTTERQRLTSRDERETHFDGEGKV